MKWTNKGHEFDDIGYLLKDKEEIYLYGAGDYAKDVLNVLKGCKKWLKWEIKFVDRDIEKQKQGYCGIEVMSPNEFFTTTKKDFFVVVCATEVNTKEIINSLIENDIQKNDIFEYNYFLYTYIPIHLVYNHNIVFFVSQNMIPSTLCNLNCEKCLNFNPYLKDNIIDEFENIKEDLDIFFNTIDCIYRFQVSGGEPFLFPILGKVLEYIDLNYRDKIIRLETVTNGTVIPNKELCQTLKKCNVTVFLDDYRNTIANGDEKYNKVVSRLEEFKIDYIDNHVDKWINMYPPMKEHSNLKDEDLKEYYTKCGNPWSTLRKKRISSCNYAHYAAKAGIIEDSEENYFDLVSFTEGKKKELIEFRLRYNEKGYIDFCKKCNGWTSINKYMVEPAIQSLKSFKINRY